MKTIPPQNNFSLEINLTDKNLGNFTLNDNPNSYKTKDGSILEYIGRESDSDKWIHTVWGEYLQKRIKELHPHSSPVSGEVTVEDASIKDINTLKRLLTQVINYIALISKDDDITLKTYEEALEKQQPKITERVVALISNFNKARSQRNKESVELQKNILNILLNAEKITNPTDSFWRLQFENNIYISPKDNKNIFNTHKKIDWDNISLQTPNAAAAQMPDDELQSKETLLPKNLDTLIRIHPMFPPQIDIESNPDGGYMVYKIESSMGDSQRTDAHSGGKILKGGAKNDVWEAEFSKVGGDKDKIVGFVQTNINTIVEKFKYKNMKDDEAIHEAYNAAYEFIPWWKIQKMDVDATTMDALDASDEGQKQNAKIQFLENQNALWNFLNDNFYNQRDEIRNNLNLGDVGEARNAARRAADEILKTAQVELKTFLSKDNQKSQTEHLFKSDFFRQQTTEMLKDAESKLVQVTNLLNIVDKTAVWSWATAVTNSLDNIWEAAKSDDASEVTETNEDVFKNSVLYNYLPKFVIHQIDAVNKTDKSTRLSELIWGLITKKSADRSDDKTDENFKATLNKYIELQKAIFMNKYKSEIAPMATATPDNLPDDFTKIYSPLPLKTSIFDSSTKKEAKNEIKILYNATTNWWLRTDTDPPAIYSYFGPSPFVSWTNNESGNAICVKPVDEYITDNPELARRLPNYIKLTLDKDASGEKAAVIKAAAEGKYKLQQDGEAWKGKSISGATQIKYIKDNEILKFTGGPTPKWTIKISASKELKREEITLTADESRDNPDIMAQKNNPWKCEPTDECPPPDSIKFNIERDRHAVANFALGALKAVAVAPALVPLGVGTLYSHWAPDGKKQNYAPKFVKKGASAASRGVVATREAIKSGAEAFGRKATKSLEWVTDQGAPATGGGKITKTQKSKNINKNLKTKTQKQKQKPNKKPNKKPKQKYKANKNPNKKQKQKSQKSKNINKNLKTKTKKQKQKLNN